MSDPMRLTCRFDPGQATNGIRATELPLSRLLALLNVTFLKR
jgi:hypothetical protein